jgi:hypothetical protein
MADIDRWIRVQAVSSRQIGHAILWLGMSVYGRRPLQRKLYFLGSLPG